MELGYPVVVKGDLFSKCFFVVVIVCSFTPFWVTSFEHVHYSGSIKSTRWCNSDSKARSRLNSAREKTKLGYRWAGNSVLSWCHYIIRSSHFVTVKWTLMVMLLHFQVFQLIAWPMVSHGFLKVTLFNKHQNPGRFQPFYLSSSFSPFHEFSIFFKQTSENTREGTINSFN